MKKVLSGLALVALVGCQTPAEVIESADIPVKVGVVTPLSGGLAGYGVETQNILAETIQRNFGENSGIEVVYEDSKCTGQDAVTAYQKLVNVDQVDVILGGLCSSESLAFAPLLEADDMVALSNVSTNPKLEGMSPNFFTLSFNDRDLATRIAKEVDFSEKVAVITEQNDWNTGILEVLEQELGDKIISSEIFEKGANDMRNLITKTLNTNPEVIILNPNAGPTSTTLITQLAESKDQLEGITLVSQMMSYLSDGVIEQAPGVADRVRVVDTATVQTAAFKDFKSSLGDIVFYTDYLVASTHDSLLNLVNAYREAVQNETSMAEELRNAKLQGYIAEGQTFGDSAFIQDVQYSTFVIEDGALKEL